MIMSLISLLQGRNDDRGGQRSKDYPKDESCQNWFRHFLQVYIYISWILRWWNLRFPVDVPWKIHSEEPPDPQMAQFVSSLEPEVPVESDPGEGPHQCDVSVDEFPCWMVFFCWKRNTNKSIRQNQGKTEVVGSGHGMFKFVRKHSQRIGDHPPTDTLFYT